MGYVLQLAALALMAVGWRLFELGPADLDSGFGRHLLTLGVIAAASITLALLGLRRIRAHVAPYWWFSSLVLLAGLMLLGGLAIDGSDSTADIGGIFLMWFGSWALACMEALALVWTLGLDVVGRMRRPAAAA